VGFLPSNNPKSKGSTQLSFQPRVVDGYKSTSGFQATSVFTEFSLEMSLPSFFPATTSSNVQATSTHAAPHLYTMTTLSYLHSWSTPTTYVRSGGENVKAAIYPDPCQNSSEGCSNCSPAKRLAISCWSASSGQLPPKRDSFRYSVTPRSTSTLLV
jgi:hypothetical protein